jgi:hypothetical protein
MSAQDDTNTALAAERAESGAALDQVEAKIVGLQSQVLGLQQQLADCQKPAGPTMLVGSSNAVGGKNNPIPFERDMGLVPPQTLDLFRCYEAAGPPANWSGSSFGQYFGRRPMWWSSKGDINDWGNPNGVNINRAKNLADTYDPDWPQMYWTIWHEVQPKLVDKVFTFAEFKRAWQTFYAAVKPIVPDNVKLMVIHGGFAWRPATKNRPSGDETTIPSSQNPYCASPAEWRSLDVDMYAVDAYGGPQAEDIIDMGRFQRFVNEMAGGDITQVAIAESNFRQSAMSSVQEGVDWVHRNGDKFAQAGLNAWCLWNSDKTVDPGPMKPEQVAAYGDVWRKYSPQVVKAA